MGPVDRGPGASFKAGSGSPQRKRHARSIEPKPIQAADTWGRVWGSVHSGVLLCTFGVFAFKSHSFQVGGEGGNVEVGLTDVITVRDLV